jgi:hypothetical protein
VDAEGFGDDLGDGVAGVEGGVGVLEDDLRRATEGAGVRIDTLDVDAAAVGGFESEDDAGERGLAAA